MFEVITDPKEIGRLNKRFGEILQQVFPVKESRKLTYPSGSHVGTVYFENRHGDRIRGWSPASVAKGKYRNFMVFGDPDSQQALEIAVQMNFPAGIYNRRPAGVFLRDTTGDVFLAHRGFLTRGKQRLKSAEVLSRFSTTVEAADGKVTGQMILIACLEHANMVEKLFHFAKEAREVADLVSSLSGEDLAVEANVYSSDTAEVSSNLQKRARASAFSKLTKYFSEFSGETKYSQPAITGKRVVAHGAVVEALAKHLDGRGNHQKNQAIDLAVVGRRQVELFEVKTSISTTDIYAGVGQLLIHGESIADCLELPVKRYLVLPCMPRELYAQHIKRILDADVVIYQKKGDGYIFEGI